MQRHVCCRGVRGTEQRDRVERAVARERGWEAESEAGTGTDTVRNGFLSNYKLSHG